MSVKCAKIFAWIEDWARPELAEEWDRIGLLVGSPADEVDKVLVTLDVTADVITEAVNERVNLIVSHHPLFRDPIPFAIRYLSYFTCLQADQRGNSPLCCPYQP